LFEKLVTNDKLTCAKSKGVDNVIILALVDAVPSSTFIWIPCLNVK
jgi:hypothetical protein